MVGCSCMNGCGPTCPKAKSRNRDNSSRSMIDPMRFTLAWKRNRRNSFEASSKKRCKEATGYWSSFSVNPDQVSDELIVIIGLVHQWCTGPFREWTEVSLEASSKFPFPLKQGGFLGLIPRRALCPSCIPDTSGSRRMRAGLRVSRDWCGNGPPSCRREIPGSRTLSGRGISYWAARLCLYRSRRYFLQRILSTRRVSLR